MTGEIGVQWIKHDFNPPISKVSNGHPRLLIVDGHALHFTQDFLLYAKEHEIHVLCLPLEAQKQADNVAHKKIYAGAMVEWRERYQMFHAAGFTMACAGDKPLLYQIKAGNYSPPLNTLSDQEENSPNIPRGRGRCPHVSIDSIPGEEFDILSIHGQQDT